MTVARRTGIPRNVVAARVVELEERGLIGHVGHDGKRRTYTVVV